MSQRPPNRHGELRDWHPDDGERCAYAHKAPALLPCGPPVKTSLQTITVAGRAEYERPVPLCANHSRAGWSPSDLVGAARKEATAQLIADHRDEFQDNIRKAVRRLLAEMEKHDA